MLGVAPVPKAATSMRAATLSLEERAERSAIASWEKGGADEDDNNAAGDNDEDVVWCSAAAVV